MRVLVAGFITIDTIQLPNRTISSVGGPPAYAGLVCARFGNDVKVLTKVGGDFPDEQAVWLARNGIALGVSDRSLAKPTTRFRISRSGDERVLTLAARCEDLSAAQIGDLHFDSSLVSPLAGEVSPQLFSEIAEKSNFTFLDPQGFLRRFDGQGTVSIGPLPDKGLVAKADAIKMDREEAKALTGKDAPREALVKIAGMGMRKGLVTSGSEPCHVLDGGKVYSIQVPKVQVVDSTGAGDVMAGSIISMYLKSRDFLWSACFGVAASSLSLHMIALAKVDLPMSVDEEAKRLYATARPIISA